MSDAHSTDHETDPHNAPHEGPIKTPKQLILAVFFSFVIPIIGIVLLANFVSSGNKPSAGSNVMTPEATEARIAPVGSVDVKDVNDASTMKTGEQVFTAQCSTCHAVGALGSPKFADAAAWAARIPKGFEALLTSALHGKGNMPAQGGGDFSDLEVARAVVYMADKGGATFPDPKMPLPVSSGGAVTAAAGADASASGAADAGSAAAQQVAAALKNMPVATVATAATGAAPGAATGAGAAAPALFTQTCSMCHASGVAGAPKFGDKAAWAPRIGQGIPVLVSHVIAGKGAMPPKGGNPAATEADITAVVTYMVNAAK